MSDDVQTVFSPARVTKRWGAAAVATAVTSLLCIAYVDRPIAYFFWPMRTGAMAQAIRLSLSVLIALPVIATGVLVVAAFARAGGGRRRMGQFPLLCSWATLAALAVEALFKHAFGRRPVEAFLSGHYRYEFLWLRGGDATSFPSGTATVCFAIVAVIWAIRPRLRWPALVLAILASVAVIVTTLHWVADVVAGTFLGVLIGWVTVQLLEETATVDGDQVSSEHEPASATR